MGRSIAPRSQGGSRRRALVGARLWLALLLASLSPLAGLATAAPAAAQSQTQAPGPDARNPDKLYVDADQLVYDKDHSTVTAIGGAVLYYKNRVLQADKVIYDRNSKRVLAEGRVKLTDERGNITYAPRFDLTDDFAAGFADSVQEQTVDKTRLSSPRIERSGGAITVLNKATYTACEPCKEHPEVPALWQVRAAKIIENQETHTVYFENAWLDIYGIPVAYIPYMSAPDPTVTRKSGVLSPQYSSNLNLGLGLSIPYFLALAPNYDLTLTPTYYSKQGTALDAIWRQRFDHGEFSIELSGIDQTNPTLFGDNRRFRGAVQSQGNFFLNQNWTAGWDFTLLTDPNYLNDYNLRQLDASEMFFQDIVSSAYLRGQNDRGFFDLTGYRFQTTSSFLDSRQEPLGAEEFDYHRTFALDPKTTGGVGGEATLELNAANVTRSEALYQAVGRQQFDLSENIISTCTTYTPGRTSNNCLLRGIAGDYGRATGQLSWQTKYVDPVGEVWSPFVFARFSGEGTDLNTTGSFNYGLTTLSNSNQPAFFNGASSEASAQAMPGVGLEYRFPFVSNSGFGQQVIEPIAQLIVRPDETLPRLQPNEDAQSLVFDDTTLFAWSKYSGYDRVEGGTRLNYGLQYTSNFANGGHANLVGGESIQLAGRNSYTLADASNTGLNSGLDKRFSNYVLGETLQPTSGPISFISKQQFDSSDFSLARFDAIASMSYGGWSSNIDYARYAAQPLLGWINPREGVTTSLSYKVMDGLTLSGGVTLDMSRHYYDTSDGSVSHYYPTGYSLALNYTTSCTTVKANYVSTISSPLSNVLGQAAPVSRTQTFLIEIDLRTLGDVKATTGIAN